MQIDDPATQCEDTGNLRDRSCRERCSERLKALLQNWHLYFFSGGCVVDALRVAAGDKFSPVAGCTLTPAAAIIVEGDALVLLEGRRDGQRSWVSMLDGSLAVSILHYRRCCNHR